MINVLYLDIETHRVKEWNELDDKMKDLWLKYGTEENYDQQSALHPEFSQAIIVSMGYEIDGEFKTMSLSMPESDILPKLKQILDAFQGKGYVLGGYNTDSFDIPYLIKRYMINGIKPPKMLTCDMFAKPWDRKNIDVMSLLPKTCGHQGSLDLNCYLLGIVSKTDEIQGKNMYTYNYKDLCEHKDELVHYCEEDVTSTWELHNKLLSLYDF